MRWLFSSFVISLIGLGIFWAMVQNPKHLYLRPSEGKYYRRVISLAPSMSETIQALKQTDRLVGVTIHCRGPEFAHLPKVGSFGEPNFEAIMALSPDLVVAVPHVMAKRVLERLVENNIDVIAHQPDSLEDIKFIVTILAKAFDVQDQGLWLNQMIDSALTQAREKLKFNKITRNMNSALIAVSSMPFVVAGKNTFASQIIENLGFYNLAINESVSWPIWSQESLVNNPPRVLILASDELSPGFQRMLESLDIKPHQIRLIVPKRPIFNSPSPAIIEDIAYLTSLLSPDV